MMKHIYNQIERETEEEKKKREMSKVQKHEMREFLNKQMEDKNNKKL